MIDGTCGTENTLTPEQNAQTDTWWKNKVSVGMVQLKDDAGSMAFSPQADITPIELAMLINLLAKLLVNRELGVPDWRSYLQEHKLLRHFTIA